MDIRNRWDPFRELEEMQNRLADFLGRTPQRWNGGDKEALTMAEWTPLVDIVEDDKQYIIKAELSEIPKEQIKVTFQNGVLVISGERKLEDKKYHRVERAYGRFMRSFTLPEARTRKRVEAKFKEGVLRLHIAKSEGARPKQIEVKAA